MEVQSKVLKVSVVTIVYNDCTHIERTVQSVLAQTARNRVEYIVIDGASSDGTSELIQRYQAQIDRYVCEPDKGIYNAMNKGLSYATGDFVVFMNSGDTFSDNSVVAQVLQEIERCDGLPNLVYGTYRETSNGWFSEPIPARHYSKIWYGMVASHQSIFYNMHYLQAHHLSYDETYKVAADYRLTLDVIHHSNGNILQLPLCIADFDVSGLSRTHQNLGLKEANRARREVLHWGVFREYALTFLLLCARCFRMYGGGLYRRMRRL